MLIKEYSISDTHNLIINSEGFLYGIGTNYCNEIFLTQKDCFFNFKKTNIEQNIIKIKTFNNISIFITSDNSLFISDKHKVCILVDKNVLDADLNEQFIVYTKRGKFLNLMIWPIEESHFSYTKNIKIQEPHCLKSFEKNISFFVGDNCIGYLYDFNFYAMGDNFYNKFWDTKDIFISEFKLIQLSGVKNVFLSKKASKNGIINFFIDKKNCLYANNNWQFKGLNNKFYKKIDENVIKVASGLNHFLILKSDNILYGIGDNLYHQISESPDEYFEKMEYIDSNVINVGASGYTSVYETQDKLIYVCGLNQYGNLGEQNIGSKLFKKKLFEVSEKNDIDKEINFSSIDSLDILIKKKKEDLFIDLNLKPQIIKGINCKLYINNNLIKESEFGFFVLNNKDLFKLNLNKKNKLKIKIFINDSLKKNIETFMVYENEEIILPYLLK